MNRKLLLSIVGFVVIIIISIITINNNSNKFSFTAIVDEVNNGSYIVVPDNNQNILKSGDKVSINTELKLSKGDHVEIVYDGNVMESYPLQINILKIKKLN